MSAEDLRQVGWKWDSSETPIREEPIFRDYATTSDVKRLRVTHFWNDKSRRKLKYETNNLMYDPAVGRGAAHTYGSARKASLGKTRRRLVRRAKRMMRKMRSGRKSVNARYLVKWTAISKQIAELDKQMGRVCMPMTHGGAADNPYVLPCHLFELTNSPMLYNAADSNFGTGQADGGWAWTLVKHNGGTNDSEGLPRHDYFFAPNIPMQTALSTSGENATATIQILAPNMVPDNNVHAAPMIRLFHKDVKFNLILYGQDKVETYYRIDLVKFKDDLMHPMRNAKITSYSTAYDQWSKNTRDMIDTAPVNIRNHKVHEWNAFWNDAISGYVGNPLDKRSQAGLNYKLPIKILKTWEYKIAERTSDRDQYNRVRTTITVPINSIKRHYTITRSIPGTTTVDESPEDVTKTADDMDVTTGNGAVQAQAVPDTNDNSDELQGKAPAIINKGTGTNDLTNAANLRSGLENSMGGVRARPEDRLYLMIRATNYSYNSESSNLYSQTTTTQIATASRGFCPSYDMCVEKSWVLPTNSGYVLT